MIKGLVVGLSLALISAPAWAAEEIDIVFSTMPFFSNPVPPFDTSLGSLDEEAIIVLANTIYGGQTELLFDPVTPGSLIAFGLDPDGSTSITIGGELDFNVDQNMAPLGLTAGVEYFYTPNGVVSAPETSTWVMALLGFLTLGLRRRFTWRV